MAIHRWPDKDPDDYLDYQHIWADWLGADTPAVGYPTSSVSSGDVVIVSDGYAGGIQTLWLSGGTNGTECRIVLHMETALGRIKEVGIALSIRAKE